MQSVTTCRRNNAGRPNLEVEQIRHCIAPENCCGALLVSPIAERIGLNIGPLQKRVLTRNVMQLMERHEIGDAALLLQRLEIDSALADEVVAEMTVGETYFFRDPAQFDLISDKVLPSLLRERAADLPIRIWSAGCSTGEEAYSLAILMEEHGLGESAEIIATDVSRAALRKAVEARYGEHSLRGEAAARMKPYLARLGNHLRLNERFRHRVRFDQLCLGGEELPSPCKGIANLDLILCRNVLIYLRPDVVRRIARQLYRCLEPGGWLLVGPSDPPLWDHAPFVTFATRAGVLYRRDSTEPGHVELDPGKAPVFIDPNHPTESDRTTDPGGDAGESLIGGRLRQARRAQGENQLVRRIQSLLRKGATDVAAALVTDAVRSHPLSAKLHHLHSVILIAEGRHEAAAAALRRVLYLNRNLAATHFLLGTCLRDSDEKSALRAFEDAFALCASRPPEEPVELMEDYSASDLAVQIGQETARLTRSAQDGS